MATLSRPVRARMVAAVPVALLVAALAGACGRDDAYCERAQAAFDDIEAIGQDQQAGTDPGAVLAKLKTSFGRLRDGAPDELRGDVDTLVRYVDALQTPADVERDEPADVRAAGDHLAQWLGRSCSPRP